MMYFQGFVIPVMAENKQAYLHMAKKAAPIFAEYGAMRTVECWGDDVMDGKIIDLKKAFRANDNETVVFSCIWWPDKATCDAADDRMTPDKPRRDAGMDALMQDPRMRETPPAWNGKLAIFGGFTPILDTCHV
jgi:uncharacterized protein YbaA (DUF1428 family)